MNYKKLPFLVRHKLEWLWCQHRLKTVRNAEIVYGLSNMNSTQKRIIVSLTSYSKRIGSVDLCIKSLLRQTVRPNAVILYLGTDMNESDVPDKLKELQNYGLKIKYNCENIKPHKKYFYAMQEFPHDIIITVDDDIVYDKNLIRSLIEAHKKFPNAVICKRANIISRYDNGEIKPYLEWKSCKDIKPVERFDLLPTGAGGVLYPPGCIDKEAFDIKSIYALCLDADDLWLRYFCAKKGTPVVYIKPLIETLAEIPECNMTGLYLSNVGEFKNDKYLKLLKETYGWEIDKALSTDKESQM